MYDTCNCEARGEMKLEPVPMATMTDLMKDTSSIASDILMMTRRINDHLFGIGNPVCGEKEATPKCFRDELERQKATLLMTAEELSKISSKLGL